MRILLIHNRYQQPGGEDSVARAEQELLSSAGHEVIEYSRHNDEIGRYSFASAVTLPVRSIWAWDSYAELASLAASRKPDIAHVHNTFPLISPAVYYACANAGVPVVHTVHNYRLFCPAGSLFRSGHVCRDCLDRGLWSSARHRCYRDSRSATASVVAMLAVHRCFRTWACMVDCFIALTESSRLQLKRAGLPSHKIRVKPNFVHPDPGVRQGAGEYAIFVGRLSAEKGFRTLLAAWSKLSIPVPLQIVGSGPLLTSGSEQVTELGLRNISFRGRLPNEEVMKAIRQARFLIFPSDCVETFGNAIIEAFACGVPVLASRLGGPENLVDNGRTGLHFNPSDPADLANKVEWAWSRPQDLQAMGHYARREYETRFTAERNYGLLMEIYKSTISLHCQRTRRWRDFTSAYVH